LGHKIKTAVRYQDAVHRKKIAGIRAHDIQIDGISAFSHAIQRDRLQIDLAPRGILGQPRSNTFGDPLDGYRPFKFLDTSIRQLDWGGSLTGDTKNPRFRVATLPQPLKWPLLFLAHPSGY